MTSRHWKGIAKPGRAGDYIRHLRTDTFPHLATLPGFLGGSILQRAVANGTEFQIVTRWTSLDAIKAFAGEDVQVAVVPPVVQELLVSYEPDVVHYDIVENIET
jgi:antibiotic biosynthesis monooxygenase (ABM) superfamily enzyme